ncbi:MAG: hypothetical protein LGB54_05870, partial [Sulfurovum sp.]|nr:hypothetical protein [Sulfurovum sp.]
GHRAARCHWLHLQETSVKARTSGCKMSLAPSPRNIGESQDIGLQDVSGSIPQETTVKLN